MALAWPDESSRIDQCEDGWFETVCVDLAGVALDRINVKPLYDDREGRINRLIVYGNRPAPPDLGEKHKHEHSQIRYGGFCRVIYLEENVDVRFALLTHPKTMD